MRKVTISSLWRNSVEREGFFRGYARIGLKMILCAVNNRRIVESDRKRRERNAEYNREYYRKHKQELNAYKVKWQAQRRAAKNAG